MTGGHVQGDILAPEDVVSLLLDDAQLEQKLREIPIVVGLIYYLFHFFILQEDIHLYTFASSVP